VTDRVFLDAGPLGMVTKPNASPDNLQCLAWLQSLAGAGIRIVVPEIADYEVRRELLRVGKQTGLRRLDALKAARYVRYAALTTEVMLRAAELWAQARRQGTPTADPKALDGDVILAAQAQLAGGAGERVIVATSNPVHLNLFVRADDWRNIQVSRISP
jgi:predicted nucleic acid-binding protein